MKRLTIIIAAALSAVLLGGCQGNIPVDSQSIGDSIKETFKAGVVDFFKSDDLEKTLGISGERAQKLEKSIESYIDDYELDDEAVEKTKAAVYGVLEKAKDLSDDELDEKIADIFKNNE